MAHLTSICQLEVPGKPQDVINIDTTARAEAGVYIIQNSLLREVLLSLCVQGAGLDNQRSAYEDLIRFLASQGPPSNDDVTFVVRHRIWDAHGVGKLHISTVVALVNNDWWPVTESKMIQPISMAAGHVFRAARDEAKHQIQLFDLLVERGCAQAMRDDFRHLMWIAVEHTSLEALEHIFQTIPLTPTLPDWQADELVPRCASGGTEPSRVEMLQFLLDRGLGVNAVSRDSGGSLVTALHSAARRGDLAAVSLLWDRDAGVYWDESNRNALELARLNNQEAVVRFLEKAFDAKGIPYDFGEEVPKVPEKEAFLENERRKYQTRARPRRWYWFW